MPFHNLIKSLYKVYIAESVYINNELDPGVYYKHRPLDVLFMARYAKDN
jgi:hypothetical protein